MAAAPKVVTVVLTSAEDLLEYHQQHLAHGGVVIEAMSAQFGQTVQVHLDLDFCGKTLIIEGSVVSATPHGTALQVPELSGEYREFVEKLQRGERPERERFRDSMELDEGSISGFGADFEAALEEAAGLVGGGSLGDEEDGDWVPPWERDAAAAEGEGFSGAAEEELDEPPPAGTPPAPPDEPSSPPDEPSSPPDEGSESSLSEGEFERQLGDMQEAFGFSLEPDGEPSEGATGEEPSEDEARADVRGENITIGSGVAASAIFDSLDELTEDPELDDRKLAAALEEALNASDSFEIEVDDDEDEEFEFDGEQLSTDGERYSLDGERRSADEASSGALEDPIYATVAPTADLGWAQPVAGAPSDLQGKVEGKVINDVVRTLSHERRSGVLRLKLLNRLLVGIWFEGRPVHFIASPPEDGKGAGEALAALPQVDADALERAVARQERSGEHLGTILLEAGVVTREQVEKVVRLEAQKYASQLPMRRGGTFGFWDCDVPGQPGTGPDIEAILRWEAQVFG